MKNNTTFKKSLLTATLLVTFSSMSALAHNSCHVELESGVKINEDTVVFFAEKSRRTLYSVENDETLMVDGEVIELDSVQQALVTQYSSSIKAMVPQVRSIAIEGVDLALEGVNLAFNELLGEGNSVGQDLTYELSNIRDEVSTRLTLEHGFTIGEDGLEGEDLLGKEFEQRIESAVESAVMSSMGTIMMAVGQEMISSGGNTAAFESRMEAFSENIEQEMESRAEQIEHKADELCVAAVQIDKLEEQLKASIDLLEDIDVISIDYAHKADSDKEHFNYDKNAM